jgi:hypothetical protein
MDIQNDMYRVGQTYPIRVLELGVTTPLDSAKGTTLTLSNFQGFVGLLPLLNGMADDELFINQGTLPTHIHIDWRFLNPRDYAYFQRNYGSKRLLEQVITFPFPEYLRHAVKIVTQPMLCYRSWWDLEWPPYKSAHFMPTLERKYACATLAAGKCPHRGVAVEAMIVDDDGYLLCPGHGLRWDPKTGRLAPRHVV